MTEIRKKFQVTGTIVSASEQQTFPSGLTKRTFGLNRKDSNVYPKVEFEILGADIEQLNALSYGDLVTVEFEIHGKGFNGRDGQPKHVNALRAYKVQKIETPAPVSNAVEVEAPVVDSQTEGSTNE